MLLLSGSSLLEHSLFTFDGWANKPWPHSVVLWLDDRVGAKDLLRMSLLTRH
jgi:hypothetical protein